MTNATLPLMSTGTYILFSFIAFIAYVFLYLSYVGLLKGRKANLRDRPPLAGYDSLRPGETRISREDKTRIAEIDTAADEESEHTPFFDYTATFPARGEVSTQENVPPAGGKGSDPEPAVEEEDDFPWPEPGEFGEDTADHAGVVGDLLPQEQLFISQLRASMQNDEDVYQALLIEYREARGKVDRLVFQTGESDDQVVSRYLDSREKVIFNLRPSFSQDISE